MSSKASCSLLVQHCHFICLLCRTNVFVATFWLKSWFTLTQGWDFILWAVCLWENAREAAVTQPHSTAGLCICVTTKLQGCAKWLVTRSRAESMLPWPKLAILVMLAKPRAAWCELRGTPVMQWGHAEDQVMAQTFFWMMLPQLKCHT